MISEPMLCSTETVHLSCVKISTISKRTELSLEPHHLGVRSGRPKWVLGRWYVWRKLYTYLALTLTLSPNGKKWDSTWPTSPRSSNGCVQDDFWVCGIFNANYTPILHQDYHYLWKGPKWASTWASSPSATNKCVQNDFWAYGMSNANHAPILDRHYHRIQTGTSEIPHDPRHQGIPSGVSKMILEPMIRLAQAVDLSYIKIKTISERTETSFHLSIIT
jgi:hypothetical protein